MIYEKGKSLQTDGQTDDGRQVIRKAHFNFSSGELKKLSTSHSVFLISSWFVILETGINESIDDK